jgi:nitric oxide reductase subunit B
MNEQMRAGEPLSSWWKNSLILVLVACFSVLIWLAAKSSTDAPPVPEKVMSTMGQIVFTGQDIMAGQQVFLKYGLMENGTIWGHGAYLGPDFSAKYLHSLAITAGKPLVRQQSISTFEQSSVLDQEVVAAEVQQLLKQNRYDPETKRLLFTDIESASYNDQLSTWAAYFSQPISSAGLPAKYITDPTELRQLTAFFAWTAWASVANRPGKAYSYTNNFPYEPAVGNTPSSDAVLWSALSLIALLAATAAVLFAFGKYDFLGWKGKGGHIHPQMIPGGTTTQGQRATIKYFGVVMLLFLIQTLVGGATAHYRVDPGGFFGIDLSALFPSNILRTWHLQAAIFWIATAYIAGGLFLVPSLSGKEPKGQIGAINFLFVALVVVIAGSMLGEILGINQLLGKFWFWFGHQGWEYLDLGRAWQILLALGLLLWFLLLFRGISPALKDPERREVSSLFLYAAFAIPLFYLPAMFFTSTTHFSVVDTWRFWIIHLWV